MIGLLWVIGWAVGLAGYLIIGFFLTPVLLSLLLFVDGRVVKWEDWEIRLPLAFVWPVFLVVFLVECLIHYFMVGFVRMCLWVRYLMKVQL